MGGQPRGEILRNLDQSAASGFGFGSADFDESARSKLKSISAIVRLFQEASRSFAPSKICSTKAGKFRDSSACPGFCAEITVVLIFVLVFGFVYLGVSFHANEDRLD